MERLMQGTRAHFYIGQVIEHKLFGYRGVIYDIDPVFMLPEEWYLSMARSRPPRDRPWYHVLVDNAIHTTYVAERNLSPCPLGEPVNHPAIEEYFFTYENGGYRPRYNQN